MSTEVELAVRLREALRDVVQASDRFVAETGLKHGDLITDAVDRARALLDGSNR